MNFPNPTLTPAMASARVRALWQYFEQSQVKDRTQLDITVQDALVKAEVEWNKSSNNLRTSRIQHNANKARIAKTIRTPYFEKARAKWHDKLQRSGLKVELWTDLTEDEMRRIANTLGAEDESDEDLVVVPESPPAPIAQPTQTSFFQPMAPSISTSSRATNLSSSSYAFVNPSEFNSEEEDFEFEIPFSNPVATSVDLTSEEDDDAAFSLPGHPVTRPSHVGSGFSRASSIQNSVSNPAKPPSTRPLVSGSAYNAASSGVAPTKRPQPSQNEGKLGTTKTRIIPRQPYVGPSLDAVDEPNNEELEFEKFKMRTRMEKIVEFHEAAALAEITLSIEIYKARKQLNNSKEEDAPRVLEHQKRMVQLQKEKEEERKAIVKSERARRHSELGRRSARGDVSMSSDPFTPWSLSSFQEELSLPSRFNLDTLLSDDPTKQETNVEGLLSELFPGNCQPPEASVGSLFNSYSSASSNQDAFRGSASTRYAQEQFRQSPSPHMSWNKSQSNTSPKPQRKTHHSLFGDSSDDEDDGHAAVRNSNGWGRDKPGAKPATPMWNNKPNAPTPAVAGGWSSKDVHTASGSSAWSNKEATVPVTQPRQGSSTLPNLDPFFADDIEPEPTATPVINSKIPKGKKPWASTSDKSSVLSPTVETTVPSSSKAFAAAETPVVPPTPAPAQTPAPAPVGKKQSKKQRQANKKGGGVVAAPAAMVETVIPEQELEIEPVPQQRESPTLETPASAPDPVSQGSEFTTWLPKMGPAITRARADSGSATPSFTWDEVASTPRPAPKIPAHFQAIKSEGTLRPNTLKRHNLLAEVFSADASNNTLDQMQPAKGPVWGSTVTAPSAGPSLWGKTKADFEPVAAQQPVSVGSGFWVPGGFDGVDNYNDEGVGDGGGGGGGGDEDMGVGLWESIAAHSKQIGKATSIPVKQEQSSIGAKRLRRVSEAASSSTPRMLGTKDPSDIGQPTVNSNSKKARGKKNGKGKQKATIEDVSDEERDNIDILPQNSSYIMESKVILEPKPSVPPTVYNSIIDFADNNNDVNDNGYSSSSFRTTVSTAPSSSADDFFSSEPCLPNGFKPQGANTSIGSEWGGMSGKHARWTPAVSHDREESDSSTFSAFGSRLQAKPSVQQTPIWGQPKKDKGKGK